MKPILCVGATPCAQRSMVFPALRIDAVNRAIEVHEYASGKSLNVARVLKELGQKPIATGFMGGPRGEFCNKQLDEIGLLHDFVKVTAPTRLCTTVIDSSTGTVTELVEESKAVDPDDWANLNHKIEELLPGCSFVVFSGSLPPAAPAEIYGRWLSMADRAGVRPVIDASGASLRQALQHKGAIVKVNRDELAVTLQKDLGEDEALGEAMRKNIPPRGMLVVTMGAAGAIAEDFHNYCSFPPLSVKAVNPVGSGDAFAAGLTAGLAAGKPMWEACMLATAAGASNATSLIAGDVRYEQVQQLLGQVKYTRVFHKT